MAIPGPSVKGSSKDLFGKVSRFFEASSRYKTSSLGAVAGSDQMILCSKQTMLVFCNIAQPARLPSDFGAGETINFEFDRRLAVPLSPPLSPQFLTFLHFSTFECDREVVAVPLSPFSPLPPRFMSLVGAL